MSIHLGIMNQYVEWFKSRPAAEAIGRYDLSQVPFKLGNILLFAQNLRCVATLTGAGRTAFYLDSSQGIRSRITQDELPQKLAFAKNLVGLYAGVDVMSTPEPSAVTFPVEGKPFDHKSYLFNHAAERAAGKTIRPRYIYQSAKAQAFLSAHPKPALALHPKFDTRAASNAKLDVWQNLISKLSARFRCIVIGNDAYPPEFKKEVSAVGGVFSQDMGMDIFDESYLIHHGRGFLGIASGPSNFAIFSDRPYLIVKHEQDAWAEKFEEVSENKLPIAGERQFFYIGDEDSSFVERQVAEWH